MTVFLPPYCNKKLYLGYLVTEGSVMKKEQSYVDPLDISLEANADSKKGKITETLLKQGNTLYGLDKGGNFVRISPSEKRDCGDWRNNKFVVSGKG